MVVTISLSQQSRANSISVYPWDQVKTICDVGGGIGHFSKALLQNTTNTNVVLFDLPETIEVAKAVRSPIG